MALMVRHWPNKANVAVYIKASYLPSVQIEWKLDESHGRMTFIHRERAYGWIRDNP